MSGDKIEARASSLDQYLQRCEDAQKRAAFDALSARALAVGLTLWLTLERPPNRYILERHERVVHSAVDYLSAENIVRQYESALHSATNTRNAARTALLDGYLAADRALRAD